MNPDLPYAYSLLKSERGEKEAARTRSLEFSAGVIAYNWSVRGNVKGLRHHNVFLSGEWRGSWDRATSADELKEHPNFYVHCPSRTDPTAAPQGMSSVMVLLPVANEQEMMAKA
eukprot:CAMPEP_0182896478 /NCGR_PEP_ID=MMETSP0034_2-20130328/26299_1 /TAXON_ID=156128 /ORGANISM="Nephroselmis pyriformis, Strain CCMP717" /LENGTH=113 /DNA_ID=CAMNT_0025030347 /DNA_START=27 /DNA_END=365 /DNA_ORIENTATION=+